MIFRPWWIFPLCLMILYVVLGHDEYYQVLQVMTKDLLLWFSGRDGYFHCVSWFFTHDGYYQVLQVMTRDLLSWLLCDDGYFHYILWLLYVFWIVRGITLYIYHCVFVCPWQEPTCMHVAKTTQGLKATSVLLSIESWFFTFFTFSLGHNSAWCPFNITATI
jgi:hypothetical protein